MTSEIRESSQFDGKPVMYFKFIRGGATWCYTSTDRFETLDEDTYTPAAIRRGAIRQGSERGSTAIKITLPADLPVAGNWRPYSPSEPINLIIMTRHVGEDDALVDWVGRITGPIFNGDELELNCEPSRTTGRRRGGDRRWQIGCDVPLYSRGVGMCNLDPEDFPVPGMLTEADELEMTVTAAAFAGASRSLAGGVLTWVDELEEQQSIAITGHTGDTLTLADWHEDLAVDLEVIALAQPMWVEAVLTDVAGLVLTAVEFGDLPANHLAGGFIRWLRADGLIETRTIRLHEGSTITIDYGALDLAADLVVRSYPGCAHTWAACGRLNNQPNYGGNLHMPIKNPYDVDPVW